MKRIFRTKMMMTATVLLLMAAVPGQQRLAAQESCVQDLDVEQADGMQGGVMQLTLEGAMDLACSQSVDAAVALNQLKSAYWQFRTYKAERLRCRRSTTTTILIRMPTVPTAMSAATGWDSPASCP